VRDVICVELAGCLRSSSGLPALCLPGQRMKASGCDNCAQLSSRRGEGSGERGGWPEWRGGRQGFCDVGPMYGQQRGRQKVLAGHTYRSKVLRKPATYQPEMMLPVNDRSQECN
jgi:hypothetical protein